MKLLCGLGNPGNEYRFTRHNIGFRIIDAFVDSMNFTCSGDKFKSTYYQGSILGTPIKVIKPMTYMNLSGEAVQKAASFFKIEIEDIWVVYDDFDLPFGTLRLRGSGSPGTHNGARNITQCLGAQAFPKLRVGIGPKSNSRSIDQFVLSNFTQDEEIQLGSVIDRAVAMLKVGFETNLQTAMNMGNGVEQG